MVYVNGKGIKFIVMVADTLNSTTYIMYNNICLFMAFI